MHRETFEQVAFLIAKRARDRSQSEITTTDEDEQILKMEIYEALRAATYYTKYNFPTL